MSPFTICVLLLGKRYVRSIYYSLKFNMYLLLSQNKCFIKTKINDNIIAPTKRTKKNSQKYIWHSGIFYSHHSLLVLLSLSFCSLYFIHVKLKFPTSLLYHCTECIMVLYCGFHHYQGIVRTQVLSTNFLPFSSKVIYTNKHLHLATQKEKRD